MASANPTSIINVLGYGQSGPSNVPPASNNNPLSEFFEMTRSEHTNQTKYLVLKMMLYLLEETRRTIRDPSDRDEVYHALAQLLFLTPAVRTRNDTLNTSVFLGLALCSDIDNGLKPVYNDGKYLSLLAIHFTVLQYSRSDDADIRDVAKSILQNFFNSNFRQHFTQLTLRLAGTEFARSSVLYLLFKIANYSDATHTIAMIDVYDFYFSDYVLFL
jgi:hypothetical protein